MQKLFAKLHQKHLSKKHGLVVLAFRNETRKKMQHVLEQVREYPTKGKVKENKAGWSFDGMALQLTLSNIKKELPLRCRSTTISVHAEMDIPELHDIPQTTNAGKRLRRALRGWLKMCTCCIRQQGAYDNDTFGRESA